MRNLLPLIFIGVIMAFWVIIETYRSRSCITDNIYLQAKIDSINTVIDSIQIEYDILLSSKYANGYFTKSDSCGGYHGE